MPVIIRRAPLRRSLLLPLFATALVASMAISSVLASTPVQNGYRDQAYAGGAFRPTAEKPQSKLWFTDNQWFAGIFLHRTTPAPTISEFRIYRLNEATHDWIDTGVKVDTRDQTHGDYLWNEATQTLWVASAAPPDPLGNDAIKVFKYDYNAGTDAYALVATFPKDIPNTATIPAAPPAAEVPGGAYSVTIDRDSSGRLWAVWAMRTEVRYSISDDGGATWSVPAQVPTQAGNSVRNGTIDGDLASVIAFGGSIGIAWSDHDLLPAVADDGYYFSVIASGQDPTVLANWTLQKLPTLLPSANESADNHINIKAASDGSVYMVGKTGKDTAGCATNLNQPLIEFFKRTPAGAWSAHLVGTAGDCNTRPQLVISEELDTAWVFLTSPNGGGSIYAKSAPLTGPDALVFRGTADTTIQRGTPFIRSETETAIDDPTTTKQSVTAASGIVVLANNLSNPGTGQLKFYLHNEMPIAAVDSTDPVGTVAVAAGAAFTATTPVVVSVPATDPGSGVSLVRLSNSSGTTGGVLSTGTSFAYNAAIAWTLPGGDGVKTVYVQWRDAAGNWSAVSNDTIVLDTTKPTGTVSINGAAATTTSSDVTLDLTADDGAGSGVASVLISNTTDFSAATPIPAAASIPWTLAAGDGMRTVYAKWVDQAGNVSASPVSDSITVDAAPTGSVVVNGGATHTNSTSLSLTFPSTATDVTDVRVGTTSDLSAATWQAYTGGMSLPFTIPAGDGPITVYAQFRDGNAGLSQVVNDEITLDQTAPTGTVSINGGAAKTSVSNVSLTFPTAAGSPTQVRVGPSPDLSAVAFQAFTPGMTVPLTLAAGDGVRTAYAQFRDAAGNASVVISDTIEVDSTIDTVKPSVPGAPVHRIAGAVTTGFPIRLNWAPSTDNDSGVSNYILQMSVNGGPYTTIVSPTGVMIDLQLSSSSKTYRFRVAARDNEGNQSAFATGIAFKTISTSESGAAVRYSGSWPLVTGSSYIGSKAKTSKVRGASATLTFK